MGCFALCGVWVRSALQVALGIFKSVVGAASFAIPWGFQEAGIAAATAITMIIGFLSYETMRILVASKQTVVKDYGRSLDYAGIVALVLGERWEIVIKAATTISCLGACTGYLIFMSTLGAELLPIEPSMLVLYAFPIVVLLSWVRNYQSMAVMTFIGNIGVALALVYLFVDGLSREVRPLDRDDMFSPRTSMLYVGPAIFLFTVHYVVLPMEKETENNPSSFQAGMKWGVVASTVFSIVLGAAGFVFYAHAPLVVDSKGRVLPGCDEPVCESAISNIAPSPMKSVMMVGLMVELLVTYMLLLIPAREYLEAALLELLPQPARREESPWRKNMLRACLVLVTTILAAAFPHFGMMIGVVGGFTDAMQAYVLPPILYLRLHQHELGILSRIFYSSISILGVTIMAYTLVNIVVTVKDAVA